VPENLRVPGISSSSSDIPKWNKRSSAYFEVLFAFATANLHDDGVIVFAHAADPEVSREIHNWAHTEDFYVAEDWFGMNDLDLHSPTNPREMVIQFSLHHWCFFLIPFLCVFFNEPVIYLADSQVLHQSTCAQCIGFKCPDVWLREYGLQS
jgi:hypothetical protein